MMAAFITVAAEATPEIATTEATAAAAAAAQQEAERVAAEKAAEEATQQTVRQGITQNASAIPPGTPPASPPAGQIDPSTLKGLDAAKYDAITQTTLPENAFPGEEPPLSPGSASGLYPPPEPPTTTLPGDPTSAAPYNWNAPTDPSGGAASGIAQGATSTAQAASSTPADIMEATGAAPPPDASNPLANGFKMASDFVKSAGSFAAAHPSLTGAGLMAAGQMMNGQKGYSPKQYKSKVDMSGFQPMIPTQQPFQRSYNYQSYAVGGPVEQMSAQNAVGANQMYPQAGIQTAMYSNPDTQRPMAANVLSPESDVSVDPYTGEQRMASGGLSEEDDNEPKLTKGQIAAKGLSNIYAGMQDQRAATLAKTKSLGDSFNEGIIPRSKTQLLSSPYAAATKEFSTLAGKYKLNVAQQPKTNIGDVDNYMETTEAANGGIMHGLGSYSDGGHLLRGPGDGVSDSIPAQIGDHQPARLADGEFVIPARIVSELGNGSTEAGARRLYAMMERVQNARKKSIGKGKVAVNSKADKHLPA